jgi:phosphoglycerol transferase
VLFGAGVFRGASFFGKGRDFGGLVPRKVVTVLLGIIVGSAGVYYAMFTVLMIVIAAVAAILLPVADGRRQTWRSLRTPAALVALICAVLAVNLSPSVIYNRMHGIPKGVTDRLPFESDLYALNLTRMLLPLDSHRIDAVAEFAARYERNSPLIKLTLEPPESIGFAAAIGYLLLLFGVPVALIRSALGGSRAPPWATRLAPASLFATTFTLIAVGGGLSAFIAYFVSPQWRAWNRVSILLAFLGLLALAIAIDALVARINSPSRRAVCRLVVLPALLVVGVMDQTNDTFILPKGGVRESIFAADQQFAAKVQGALPQGSEVYQLPYVAYPEPSPSPPGLGTYDNAIPYVQTKGLKWSWGGVRGRPADYPAALQGLPVEVLLPSVAAAGFDGLWVDRAAYKDSADAIIRAAVRLTRAAPLLQPGPRHRYAYISLDGLVQRLGLEAEAPLLGDITVHPFVLTFGEGFHRLESDGERTWRWAKSQATIDFENSLARSRTVVVSGDMVSSGGAVVTAQLPGGAAVTVPSNSGGAHFELRVDLPPGASSLRFSAPGSTIAAAPGDNRPIAFGIYDPSIIDAAYLPLLTGTDTPTTY